MRSKLRFLFRALLVFVGIPLLPLAISGRWDWTAAWAFFGISVVGTLGSRVAVAFVHPDLLAERDASFGKQDVPPWDRVLAPAMAIGALFIPLVAGIEARRPVVDYPLWAEAVSAVAMFAGYAFGSWAMVSNAFFSGTVRLQTERGHHVVTGGPYAAVRHPGYLGALVAFAAEPFLLDAVWALVPVLFVGIVTFVRTSREDAWLHANLDGYAAYAQRTRSRLIPGIW